MRLTCALSTIFVLGATSTLALAEDVYRPQVIPPCSVYVTPAGEVCGYLALEDWKAVLRADAELVHARIRLKNDAERLSATGIQLTELRAQVVAFDSSLSALKQRNVDLTKQLVDLDLKYQQERASSGFWSPLPWAIAGITTAVLAGFVLASVAN